MEILLDESVQNYIAWLKAIKKAPYHTFRAYQVDLSHFLKYFLRLEINDIPSSIQMEEYLAFIKNKYNYASYRRKVTVLRSFITYLIDSGINVPDPFVSISLPLPNINFNLPAQYEDILNLIELLPENNLQKIRDKLIFCLISKSGLTIKQLLSLKLKDINLANNQIIISRDQLTFLDEKNLTLLEKYLSILKEKTSISLDDYLINNHTNSNPKSKIHNSQFKLPLSTRTINLIIDKISKGNNFKARLSPTILRRLFAKSLNEKNVNKATKELIFGKKCRLVG